MYVTVIDNIEKIDFNHFNDIFALKWLISIICMHGVIEKVEINGAPLSYRDAWILDSI